MTPIGKIFLTEVEISVYFLFRFVGLCYGHDSLTVAQKSAIIRCNANQFNENGRTDDFKRNPYGSWRMGNADRHHSTISRHGFIMFKGYFLYFLVNLLEIKMQIVILAYNIAFLYLSYARNCLYFYLYLRGYVVNIESEHYRMVQMLNPITWSTNLVVNDQ